MRHEAQFVACRVNVRGVFLLDFESADLERHRWVAERFVGGGETMPLSFHTFALAVGDRRILVDTGAGTTSPAPGSAPTCSTGSTRRSSTGSLAAGFAPESIDTVVCTHLHVDHVG